MAELRKRETAEDKERHGSPNSMTASVLSPQVVDYGSASAYVAELRKWMFLTQCWAFCHQMATMHSFAYMTSCIQSGQSTVAVPFNTTPVLVPPGAVPPAVRSSTSTPNSGRFIQRRMIPSFTRRILAEIIDSIFAFAAKLFFVYFLVEIGIVDLDKYDRLLGDDADLQALIDVTQELFPIEMFAKIVVSVVEAFFISYGFASVPAGQTPGKVVLNIQVITCYQVIPIPGSEEVDIVRTLSVPFKNSLIRSLMKNMLINLLFPLSAAAYAFTYNRAGYDIAAKTIVVSA